MPDDQTVNIDLTKYKDRFGTRVMPGRYRVLVEDAELDSTREGKAMINVFLRVQGSEFDGATVVDRLLPEHERSLFRVVGFMQAIGLPTPRKRLRINLRQFIGKVLEVDVEDGDPYNGRVKSEVRGYMRIMKDDKGSTEATDVDDLAGLEEFAAAPDNEADGRASVAARGGDDTKPKSDEFSSAGTDEVGEVDLDEIDLG